MFIHWHLQSTSDLDKLIKDVNENEAPDDAPQLPKEPENLEGITFNCKFIIYHITIWAPY